MRFIFLSIVLIFLSTLSTHAYGNELPAAQSLPDEQSIQRTPDIQSLINALEDKDESIRIQAAEMLGDNLSGSDVHAEEAVAALIHALNDPKWRVRRNAIITLGKIGSPDAVCTLIKCLKDENWIIRSKAVHAL
ncbi:MAG: HEAT repeat domain-containing protein, partial [Candidatus Desantisbacteria bacterium]